MAIRVDFVAGAVIHKPGFYGPPYEWILKMRLVKLLYKLNVKTFMNEGLASNQFL